jgi:hypothetical protein
MRVLFFIFLLSLSLQPCAVDGHFHFELKDFGKCAGCHCIKGGDSCPDSPRVDFTGLQPTLDALKHKNKMRMPCDPYNDTTCDTVPPLEQGGACVIDYVQKPAKRLGSPTCPKKYLYGLRTYPKTTAEAHAEGLIVTHDGACGVCSSLADLNVYIEQGPLLRGRVAVCALKLLTGETEAAEADALDCLLELDFTEPCARIWLYNTINTAGKCQEECKSFLEDEEAANGPAPDCTLAECLECDESQSGPTFQQYAGRTRRNSGLLSDIVRPCSDLVDLEHADPCNAPVIRPCNNAMSCSMDAHCCGSKNICFIEVGKAKGKCIKKGPQDCD